MKSVRKHLLVHLLTGLLMASMIVGVVSYFSSKDEVDELYDEHLRQIALVLESQKSVLARSEEVVSPNNKLKGEEEFLIQIWGEDGSLIYSSHPLIKLPQSKKEGFATQVYNTEEWRSYSTKPNNLVLQVGQPIELRDDMLVEMAFKMLVPILLQFPMMALFIWLAVGSGLESLSIISMDIKKRSETSLRPLSLNGIPEEIMPLVHALNELLVQLDNAMQMQRQFTADAAHELRTPLTAVTLQLALLERTQSEAERADALKSLMSGVQRSISLVEQLLAFARVEGRVDRSHHKQIDLAPVMHDIVASFTHKAIAKQIDLGLVREESAIGLFDLEEIYAVFNNLIENALRYTQEGGRVDVSVYTDQGKPVIIVADNGRGIPPEEHTRIFDRFYRVLGNKESGTGLGLAIVKSILDKSGASIHIAAGIDGKGTEFKIIFPARMT